MIRIILPKVNNLSARVSHASFPVTYVLRAEKKLSIVNSLCAVRAEDEERIRHSKYNTTEHRRREANRQMRYAFRLSKSKKLPMKYSVE